MPDPENIIQSDSLKNARRIVVKVGSSLLVDSKTGHPRAAFLKTLAEDIALLRANGCKVVLVSSGAVALGRARLRHSEAAVRASKSALKTSVPVPAKKAAAAVGQTVLMHAWEAAFQTNDGTPGVTTAQVLLTRYDTERRERWLSARATLEALLKFNTIPVVNENDTVATDEIRYGDNDRLAARAAQLVQSDLLVLLSDVDGLYTADPRSDPEARHLPVIDALGPDILAMAGGTNQNANVGTGGMATKLEAVRIARAAGCATLIVSGLVDHPLQAVLDGARSTLFPAADTPHQAYKTWIAGSLQPSGTLVVDDGAAKALRAGRSLLASGVVHVEGEFRRGDSVRIQTQSQRKNGSELGTDLGVGLAAYPLIEMLLIRGQQSSAFESLVGYKGPGVAIHRNDLVLNPS